MNEELKNEPRDYTRWIWMSIIIFILVLAAVFWKTGAPKPPGSAVRISHILLTFSPGDNAGRLRALELAEELRERIQNGESFEKLASEYSQDPGSRKRGGDVGFTGRDELVKSVDKYAWSAPIGQLSEVLQSNLGYHIVKVTDRHVSGLDESEQELERKAREMLQQERLKQLEELQGDDAPEANE